MFSPLPYLYCSWGQFPTFGAPVRGLRRVFNLDTTMAGSRAERLARRTASAATAPPATRQRGRPRGDAAPERRVDPEPRVEHPADDDDVHAEDDLGEEEASSLHPSRDGAASSLGRPAPSPATALLMAQELLRYRPTPEAQEAWLHRLSELVGAARVAAPAPSRSLVPSGRVGDVAHGAPPANRPRGSAAPERRVDPEPYVEHPEDNDDGHAEDDLGEEEASSLHPSCLPW